jgi:hypothetical protein
MQVGMVIYLRYGEELDYVIKHIDTNQVLTIRIF